MSADSMLRTTCLACWSLVVSTWISLTSPGGVTTTRADRMPVRLAIRISARFTPHGSGACGGVVSGNGSRFSAPSGLEIVTPSVLPSPPGFDPRPWRGTARGRPPPARLPSPGPGPARIPPPRRSPSPAPRDRKSTRLNSSHGYISYAVFCLKQNSAGLDERPGKNPEAGQKPIHHIIRAHPKTDEGRDEHERAHPRFGKLHEIAEPSRSFDFY